VAEDEYCVPGDGAIMNMQAGGRIAQQREHLQRTET
jgi:hypothetical protein